MFFYRLFVLLLFAIKDCTVALRCYSCGDENIFLGQEYPSPSPCEDMEKSDNLESFVIECPQEFLGCITQSRGAEIMRTCDTLAIDDCKTANGITYCYCSEDLCNGKTSHMDAHKSSRDLLVNYPSDDEDYSDSSSGYGQSDHEFDDEFYRRSNQTSKSSRQFHKYHYFTTTGIITSLLIMLTTTKSTTSTTATASTILKDLNQLIFSILFSLNPIILMIIISFLSWS